MALPRIQALIVKKLNELGHLTLEDMNAIMGMPGDMTSQAFEKRLEEEYRVKGFHILAAKAKAFDMNPFHADNFVVNDGLFADLDENFCFARNILPIGKVAGTLVLASPSPFEMRIADDVRRAAKSDISVLLGSKEEIMELLKQRKKEKDTESIEGAGAVIQLLRDQYQDEEEAEEKIEEVGEDDEAAPIIQLGTQIVEEAYALKASDVHIEPFEKEYRIRFRIDGVCRAKFTLPRSLGVVLVTRFKVMANLDIAEKRLPQDGRINFKKYSERMLDIDLRVSSAPLNYGEGLVMRILDKQASTLPLEALGFEPENLRTYQQVIKHSYGMILHCGPTGSGKSMTLYSALNTINSPDLVIRTAEDPVEYTQPGLLQMQVSPKIGLTFATALRAFLRQDPDVILVGEIRDIETASIAVEAALTGHLLFSTLHTNDAPSSIARLTEMGIEPFMISASLICVCAQRLLRRVCKKCRVEYMPDGREREILNRAIGWSGPIYRSKEMGCPSCSRIGYKGRTGIHELMVTTENMIDHINKGTETLGLKTIAIEQGMHTLHQDSMVKVRAGITSMIEAIGVIQPDLEDLERLRNAGHGELEAVARERMEKEHEAEV